MNPGSTHPLRCLAMLLVATAGVVSAGDPFGIGRFTIDGGGVVRSTGGDFELSGTIGQPDAGAIVGGGFEMTGGFWFPQVPADCNSDGGVSLFDFADFQACVTAPGIPPVASECACFDLDGDDDVDLLDFGAFQFSFTSRP